MKKSRLFQLFSVLNNEQLRHLKKFVRSPYYNHREDVVLLLDYLLESKRPGRAAPDRERAFNFLYGDKKFNDGRIRLVMTFLLKIMERFLVQFENKDEVKSGIALAGIYRKLNLDKHFEHQLKQLNNTQKKMPHRNIAYYERYYEIEWERYGYAVQYRRGGEQLNIAGHNLDIVYFVKKLEQASYGLVHTAVYKTKHSPALLSEILEHIEQEGLCSIPIVSIYYHCYLSLSQPPESGWFHRFRRELDRHKQLFPAEELGSLYLLALNFCIRQYNAGNNAYLQEEFELYREGLEGGYLYKDGYLSRFTYRNIMTVCIAVNQLSWAADFIHRYRSKLEPQYREAAFSFNLARLAYQQKDYKAALILLQKSEFEEIFINISAKILMVKIFYETEEWDVLQAHLDSMKVFLYRKRNIGLHKENYLNFIRLAQKLPEINYMSIEDKIKLQTQIQQEKRLAERAWLLIVTGVN